MATVPSGVSASKECLQARRLGASTDDGGGHGGDKSIHKRDVLITLDRAGVSRLEPSAEVLGVPD